MPRREKKYHYIYKTICLVTGKYYVGMHSTDNLEDGYLGSGKILGYSRRKHGDENHRKEIVEQLPTREALKLRERELVNEAMLADPLNMNLRYGGEGGWSHITKEHKRKGGFAAGIRNFQNAAHPFEERSAAMKKAAQTKATNGTLGTAFLGRSHSDATKLRMATSMKGLQSGSANSQFGTCWVTNGTPIKIKKEQLDEYLAKGYSRGRTLHEA